MVIFTKTVNDIESVNTVFDKSCSVVSKTMKTVVENNTFNSYEDYVAWALKSCLEEIPSPFSFEYPACYGLTLGSSYFTIRIPNKFGIGIKVMQNKKTSDIFYAVDIIFYNDEKFIKQTSQYNDMIENGWKVKEKA